MGVQELSGDDIRGERLLSSGAKFTVRPGFFARFFAPGFRALVDRIDAGLASGSLLAHFPDGTTRTLGGRAPGFEAEILLRDWRAVLRLATGGIIGFYQAYEAGEWDTPDMTRLFALFSANVRTLGDTARISGPFRWAAKFAHLLNRNSREGSARNIAAHYDLGNDFYRAWLDPSMSYSSARFESDDDPHCSAQKTDRLHKGQISKISSIANRIETARGGCVLEIGCGWGQLAGHLAERLDVRVDAISLSNEQLAYARAINDSREGSSAYGKIDYRYQDYRDVCGQYDAIVSVEMVEALGREYWGQFMDSVDRCLKPGGRAAIQFISMADDLFEEYANTVDFIQAYVFPGGLLIRTSEFRALAEERGLQWEAQENFGPDYAETLKLWHDRFEAAEAEGRLPRGFDGRFVRLWKFYLAYCEGGFRAGNIDVHQVTLVKPSEKKGSA